MHGQGSKAPARGKPGSLGKAIKAINADAVARIAKEPVRIVRIFTGAPKLFPEPKGQIEYVSLFFYTWPSSCLVEIWF
jgi:hypothetical protein